MKKYLWGILAFACAVLSAENITVNPRQAEIICPAEAVSSVKFAASELQKHLRLITRVKLPIRTQGTPGKYQFCLLPPGPQDVPLPPEAARIVITPRVTYLYGENFSGKTARKNSLNLIFRKYYRTGTLFAVYDFLEKHLDVKWLEPGDAGILVVPQKQLTLRCGNYQWNPPFIQREIRRGYYSYTDYNRKFKNINSEFKLSRRNFERKMFEINVWLKRHKMGNSYYFVYGHAFTNWWKLYGKSHPEYFAMQQDGVRRPLHPKLPYTSKLCVSNPAVSERIVKQFGQQRFINICENDWGGYCQCSNCRKLDEPRPGEKFGEHLTDRYVWFANQIQKKVAKINPQAQVVMYAYDAYHQPPRREKIDSRIIVGFVPSMLELKAVETMYQQWSQKGLRQIFLRPNDHHVACGLPMGYERQMFEAFQLGVKYGIIGTDYDCLHNFWPTGGLADYILVRAHEYPDRSYEYWENEYCAIYGAAAPEVKAYYRYWQTEIWEKRLLKNRAEILRRGRYGNFRRGLMWNLKKYYRISDFAATQKILESGLKKSLTAEQRKRLLKLKLTLEHARLTYEAVLAQGEAKIQRGKVLLQFRRQHRGDLNFDWGRLASLENEFGDITGIQIADKLNEYRGVKLLPLQWYFKIDPEQRGTKEAWERSSFDQIRTQWSPIKIDRAWERQSDKVLKPKLQKILKNYNGIGYYGIGIHLPQSWKSRQIGLFFGGVDESAWCYVNGKLAGKRINSSTDDWKTPFVIWIDAQIDWSKPLQDLVIKVQDEAGAGGIWRPVYLIMK